jgi:hypothetical protein
MNNDEYLNSIFILMALFNTYLGLNNTQKNDNAIINQRKLNDKINVIEMKVDKILSILEDEING